MELIFIPYGKSSFRVGRSPDNDFVLNEPFVSRHHFTIFREYGGFVGKVVVTGANGLSVNGRKLGANKSEYLREGDYVTLCKKVFVYCGPDLKGEFFLRKTDALQRFGCEIAEYEGSNSGKMEIEGPPGRKAPEKPSIMLAAGPALTMAIPILLGCGRTVAILSSIIAAFWAVGNVLARHRKLKREEIKRKMLYVRYLEEKKAELAERLSENRKVLLDKYPGASEYFATPEGRSRIWRRSHENDELGAIRVGLGRKNPDFELILPKERLDLVDDSLKGMPAKIREDMYFLEKVPILENLENPAPFGFMVSEKGEREFVNAFIMQFAANFPPEKMEIVMSEDDNAEELFPFVALLPHYMGSCVDGSNSDGRNSGGSNLGGNNSGGKQRLVITTVEQYVKIIEYGKGFTTSGTEKVTYVILNKNGVTFPPGVRCVSNKVSYDRLPDKAAYGFALYLSKLWSKGGTRSFRIPDIVGFEEIAKCEKGSDFGKADITKSIKFPIGINKSGNVTYLDLHERGDGPHGLIAGTTGSGKSELITTIILSAANIYTPWELNFFIIDFKGGGTSNLFSSLPHLSGVMTNLSVASAKRVIISLKSENLRRQRLFGEAGVNNIGEYIRAFRRGRCNEMLPHIVIIVDEFAELKKEQPEFMDSLISIAQIGRSLGMHLILSTQKPAGVVDEKIRSNTKFKIALRVEEKADSSDVLGITDAADISVCGRAIIRRGGSKEYESFQSAYAMGLVNESDSTKPEVYLDPFMSRVVNADIQRDLKKCCDVEITWFDYFMKRICERSGAEGFAGVRPLWLPPLPDVITSEAGEFAWADNPYNHSYDRIFYNPPEDGNAVVIGGYGSGTDKLIMAMLLGICRNLWESSEQMRELQAGLALYICDFSEGLLRSFSGFDICGGVVTTEDAPNALMMLKFIHEMLNDRRKSGEGGDVSEPTVVFVITNFGELYRNCDENISVLLEDILRYGRDLGIYTVISAFDVSPREFPQRLFDMTDMVLLLGNAESFRASMILKCPPSQILRIREAPGRGMLQTPDGVLEFQTVTPDEDVTRKEDVPLKSTAERRRAKPYPFIPKDRSIEKFLERAVFEHPPHCGGTLSSGIPVGYIRDNAGLYMLPVGTIKCILINGSTPDRRMSFIGNLSIILARYEICHYFADTYETVISILKSEHNEEQTVILARELTTILKDYYSTERGAEEKAEFEDQFDNSLPRRNKITIIAATDEKIRTEHSHRDIYQTIMKKSYGITLGGDVLSQRIFDYSYIPYSQTRMNEDENSAMVKKYDNRLFYGEIILPEEITGDVDNSPSRINRG